MMKRRTLRRIGIALAVVAVAAVAARVWQQGRAGWHARSAALPATAIVRKVIDGDTVELASGERVRYIGIDTPEVRRREGDGWQYDPEPYALAAREYTTRLVEGRRVSLAYDEVLRDKYGRLLAYMSVDGTLVNAALLEQGLALLYTIPPNCGRTAELTRAMRSARDARRGLWADQPPEPLNPDTVKDHIGKVATVVGAVVSTHQSKKAIYLNFGGNYRTDFTIVIFKGSWGVFRARGIDPAAYYPDKLVRVVGRIKEYNGPEIVVNHPDEIEVLAQ